MRLTRIVAISGAVIAAIAVAAATGLGGKFPGSTSAPAAQQPVTLPHTPAAYIGVYTRQAPQSYAGVTAFTAATGIRPSIVLYYSGWPEPFQAHFAATVARHNAVPLVQMDPTGASIAAIAAGRYDDYLRSFASAVKAFDSRVILSFGHEMNGVWYSWGYRHVPPAVFVAAWRRIVTVFRQQGADKVTWLWTVNVIHERGDIPSPAPWWPGRPRAAQDRARRVPRRVPARRPRRSSRPAPSCRMGPTPARATGSKAAVTSVSTVRMRQWRPKRRPGDPATDHVHDSVVRVLPKAEEPARPRWHRDDRG